MVLVYVESTPRSSPPFSWFRQSEPPRTRTCMTFINSGNTHVFKGPSGFFPTKPAIPPIRTKGGLLKAILEILSVTDTRSSIKDATPDGVIASKPFISEVEFTLVHLLNQYDDLKDEHWFVFRAIEGSISDLFENLTRIQGVSRTNDYEYPALINPIPYTIMLQKIFEHVLKAWLFCNQGENTRGKRLPAFVSSEDIWSRLEEFQQENPIAQVDWTDFEIQSVKLKKFLVQNVKSKKFSKGNITTALS